MPEDKKDTEEELNPPMRSRDYIEILAARDNKAGWTTKIEDVPDSADLHKKSGAEIAVFLAQLISSGMVLGLRMEIGKPVKIKFKVPATGSIIDEEYLAEATKVLETKEAQDTIKLPEVLTHMSVADYHSVVTRLANLVVSGDQKALSYAQNALEVLKKQTESKPASNPMPKDGVPGQDWFPPEHE